MSRYFTTTTVTPNLRRVTFSNPPVNLVGADAAVELSSVIDELSADDTVRAVIFDSSTAGYFYNHADLTQIPELLAFTAVDGTPGWVDLAIRISEAPFVSIAAIRGHTRGGGTSSLYPSICGMQAVNSRRLASSRSARG